MVLKRIKNELLMSDFEMMINSLLYITNVSKGAVIFEKLLNKFNDKKVSD